MSRLKIITALAATLFLMGGSDGGGCNMSGPLPSVEYIDLNLPDYILNCPSAPKSPGRNATKKQRAQYLQALYFAWEKCNGNLATVRKLYKSWNVEIEALKAGDRG